MLSRTISQLLAILCCAAMLQFGLAEISQAQGIPTLPRPDIGRPGGQGDQDADRGGRQDDRNSRPRRGRGGIQGADMATDKDDKKAGKFEELLENKDLSRFRGYKQQAIGEGWTIKGKNVHFDGSGGGDMVTVDEYDNFELQFDWKISEGGNSGVMYRVSLGDDAPYLSGPEYQVLDNEKHADGKNELTSAGSLYAMYPPSEKKARKPGIWNTTKIIVDGNKVVHYLNGTKVVEAEIGSDDWNSKLDESKFKDWEKFAKNSRGHIAFQDHGDEVWYRKIRIKRLASSTMTSDTSPRGNADNRNGGRDAGRRGGRDGRNDGPPGGLVPPVIGSNGAPGGPPAGVGDRSGRGGVPPMASDRGSTRQNSNGKARRPRPNFKPTESGFEKEDDKKKDGDKKDADKKDDKKDDDKKADRDRGGPPPGVGDRGSKTTANGKKRRPRPNFKPTESGFESEDDKKEDKKDDKKEDKKDDKDN